MVLNSTFVFLHHCAPYLSKYSIALYRKVKSMLNFFLEILIKVIRKLLSLYIWLNTLPPTPPYTLGHNEPCMRA